MPDALDYLHHVRALTERDLYNITVDGEAPVARRRKAHHALFLSVDFDLKRRKFRVVPLLCRADIQAVIAGDFRLIDERYARFAEVVRVHSVYPLAVVGNDIVLPLGKIERRFLSDFGVGLFGPFSL